MNATASSQTGCSDLASAPELCPYGAPAAATSPPAFVNKPYPFSNSYQISLLLNLTNTTTVRDEIEDGAVLPIVVSTCAIAADASWNSLTSLHSDLTSV